MALILAACATTIMLAYGDVGPESQGARMALIGLIPLGIFIVN